MKTRIFVSILFCYIFSSCNNTTDKAATIEPKPLKQPLYFCTIKSKEFKKLGFSTEYKKKDTTPTFLEKEKHIKQVAESLFLWDIKQLRIYFYDGDIFIRDKVIEIAKQWSKFSGIDFKETGSPENAEIRISFRLAGYWSIIGSDAKNYGPNVCTMSLDYLDIDYYSNPKEFKKVVLHEFGHAMGLLHEHQHPSFKIKWKLPALYKYYDTTFHVDSNWVYQNVIEKYNSSTGIYDAPDPKSIMIYAIPKTITENQFEVPWPDDLSQGDKSFIFKIYHLKH